MWLCTEDTWVNKMLKAPVLETSHLRAARCVWPGCALHKAPDSGYTSMVHHWSLKLNCTSLEESLPVVSMVSSQVMGKLWFPLETWHS